MNLKNDKFQCLSTHINTYIENSISLKPKSSSMSFDFKTKSRIYQTENRMKI
jgi:hypothetical protein